MYVCACVTLAYPHCVSYEGICHSSGRLSVVCVWCALCVVCVCVSERGGVWENVGQAVSGAVEQSPPLPACTHLVQGVSVRVTRCQEVQATRP